MKNALNQSLEQMLATARNKRLRRRVLAFLSAFVLLLTVNGTKFTADTLERIEGCGLAEHAHAAECYDADGNLTCGLVEHVHTDACYQTRPVKQTADEGEPDPSAEAVDAAPAELDDYALGGDASEAAPEAAPAGEEAPADAAEPEYEYTVGEVCPVLLADIIAAVGLPVDASAAPEAWQVIDDAHPEGLLRIEADEDGTAIYPTRSFDRAELAVIAGEDIYTVALLNAVVPQLPQEAEAEAEPETETEPETIAETETVVDAETETETEIEVETETETVVDAEHETEVEADAEPEVETEAEAEPETEDETVIDAEPETEAETEAETESETEAETVVDAEPEVEAETETDSKPETDAETVVVAEPETETGAEAEADAESEVETEPETDGEPEAIVETETEVETETGTDTEAEPEDKLETKEDITEAEADDQVSSDVQKPSPMGAKPSEQSERQVDQPEAETEEVSSSEPTDDPSAASDDDSSADPSTDFSDEPSDDDSSADPSEEPSDDDSSADPSEEPTDTPTEESSEETSDEPTAPEATDSPKESSGEPSDEPTSPSPAPATQALYRADIDLTDAEAPFSLAGWVALAQPVEMEPEDAETVDPTPAAEETEQPADAEPAQADAAEPATFEDVEAQPDDAASDDAAAQPDEAAAPAALPMEAWTIEYDTELFAIEPIDGDYSVTPLGDFDAAEIAIDAGDIAYALTLSHWTGEAEPEAEPEEAEPELLSGAFAVPVEGADYALTVDVPEEAALPASATFVARAVEDDVYNRAALAAVAGDDAEDYIILAMFDLTLYDGDQVIKPEAALRIGVQFADATEADRQLFVVHFPGSGAQPESAEAEVKQPAMLKSAPKKLMAVRAPQPETELVEVEIVDGAVEFSADAFSMFSVLAAAKSEDVTGRIGETNQDNVPVYSGHNLIFNSQVDTIAEKGTRVTLLSATSGSLNLSSWYQIGYGEDKTGYVEQKYIDIIEVPEPVEIESDSFKATVSYEAGVLPDGATLSMGAVQPEESAQTKALEALGQAFENKQFEIREIQYFDLTFTNEDKEIEPNGAVGVSLSMKQPMTVAANEKLYLIHFANNGVVELVDSARFAIADGAASGVDFTVGSFSTFAVVKVIETTVMTRNGETYRIRVLYGDETGIPEDAELVAEELLEDDMRYPDCIADTAEALGETVESLLHVRLFDIAIIDPDGAKVPLSAPVQVIIEYVSPVEIDPAQPIQVVHFGENATEIITPETNRDEAGTVDAFSFEATSFSIYSIVSSGETANLNGRSFAIINTYTNNAIQAEPQNNGARLAAEGVQIIGEYVTANDDISMWTFTADGNNQYYIQSDDGRYLNIYSNSLQLSTNPQLLTVTLGSGNRTGKVRISRTNYAVNNYSGSTKSGFGTYNDNGNNEWFTLYALKEITLNPAYSADKISVQDLLDAQQVIIYKSVYNENTEKYEDYVIDGNGDLVKAYDKGNQVVGRSAVSTVWSVMMHRDETTQELNGYYDFYNEETHMFLSPQADGTLVASTMPGVLLNGRRDGEYNSTIEAWSASDMAYYGCQITTDESGDFILTSGTGSNGSQPFSFAAYVSETTNELHTVDTVDSKSAGITIKMYDFSSRSAITNVVDGDTYIEGNHYNNSGLASKTLVNGFPYFRATGKNASELFSGSNYKGEANNLFLASVYNSTGYYEYSSFNNFAHYDQSTGSFTVYQEIGTPSNDNKYFYKRGNFFPYNDLDATRKATNVNLYDGSGNPIDPLDPTQSGTLYMVNNANFYFGMTMEATFMQPKNGRDKNGPVVYEFNGDDDLWIYIDGVLVLDIGGVHDALPGTINFATGAIQYDDSSKNTTIKACFEAAGVFPDGTAWDNSKVDQYFKGNTFVDYGSHSFKMFYMEHGAGASNLEMHFNLPVIEKGKFTVEKVLDGTSQQKFANVHFAFQAFKKEGNDEVALTEAVYEGTTNPVLFYDSVVINGKTYNNVFYLKPGEAATFAEMRDDELYFVRELGVGTDYYDEIIVNDVKIDGEEATEKDGIYPTTVATVGSRARVTYANHCSEKNLNELWITKRISAGSVDDGSTFEFRVLIESADGTLAPYSTGAYYIQNDDGDYFHYVNGELTNNGKTPIVASFSGMNGTINGIPADYTVVIKDLLADTDFYVEEIRLPDGWDLEDKTVVEGSCAASTMQGTGFSNNTVTADGQIILNTDAKVVFTNKGRQRIIVKKEWQSGDLVTIHGDIHVALFTADEDGNLTLKEGSLRTISAPETTVEYQLSDMTGYVVREVTVDDENVTPIKGSATIAVSGETTTVGVNATDSYIVTYEQGNVVTQDEHGSAVTPYRTDTITNTMPTLTVNKTDLDGNILPGAVFTLLKEDKTTAVTGYEHLVSDGTETGNLLNAVRLPNGTYYLKEIEAPAGYLKLENMLKLTVATVAQNGISMMTDVNTGATIYEDKTQEDHTTFTFAVTNNPGARLPSTGGSGTTPYTLAGIALMGIALFLLLRRRAGCGE